MPTITDITKQKKSDQLYNIFVDGKFAFGLSDLQISSLGLKIGQSIEQAEIDKLQVDATSQKAFHRALYYLKFRARSQTEMTIYLSGKGFDEDIISQTIKRLKKENYLDDQAFANSWAINRLQFRHYPLSRIKMELRQKGISKDIIDVAINSQGEDAELSSLIDLASQKKRQSKYSEPQKLMAYLTRKGYSYGLVKQAIEKLSREDENFNQNSDDDQPKQT